MQVLVLWQKPFVLLPGMRTRQAESRPALLCLFFPPVFRQALPALRQGRSVLRCPERPESAQQQRHARRIHQRSCREEEEEGEKEEEEVVVAAAAEEDDEGRHTLTACLLCEQARRACTTNGRTTLPDPLLTQTHSLAIVYSAFDCTPPAPGCY